MPRGYILQNLLIALFILLNIQIEKGVITYYNPGIMQIVYDNRIKYDKIEPCADCIDYVAVMDCNNLNKKVWIEKDAKIYGPYLAIDCADKKHIASLRARNRILEVSYEQAMQWKMNAPLSGITIYITERSFKWQMMDSRENLSQPFRSMKMM